MALQEVKDLEARIAVLEAKVEVLEQRSAGKPKVAPRAPEAA